VSDARHTVIVLDIVNDATVALVNACASRVSANIAQVAPAMRERSGSFNRVQAHETEGDP